MPLYLLFENASGFGLFERVKSEVIGNELDDVQKVITDLKKFSEIVKCKAFIPFTSAEDALENINAISDGEITEFLSNFLEMNLKKSKKVQLGVVDPKVGNAIQEVLGLSCVADKVVLELLRGIRLHFDRFVQGLKASDVSQAQLGLGHSYSRAKVKFNVHKVDNMIIQSIALIDQMDKDLNTFAMRVREWYGYHFPELAKIVNDNYLYARVATFIKNKSNLSDESLEGLEEIVHDEEKAKQILQAARMSHGTDISEIDLINIDRFATRVISLSEYRAKLYKYLVNKMETCAPNLTALIGEQVGARLISHAGSLTNLAKYPASTLQILGAEKALFRALKTKGNTPKYGLIYHSTFIGRAQAKNKGRISRYLANKCSMASRIDSFTDDDAVSNQYGLKLRQQVEERLEFFKTGATPRKNIDVMNEVKEEVAGGDDSAAAAADVDMAAAPAAAASDEEEKEKKSKKKKRKRDSDDDGEEEAKEKKKKKKSKKSKKSKK